MIVLISCRIRELDKMTDVLCDFRILMSRLAKLGPSMTKEHWSPESGNNMLWHPKVARHVNKSSCKATLGGELVRIFLVNAGPFA